MRSKLNISPATVVALFVMFLLGTAAAATAGSVINGKKIKKGSIPYTALSKDAKKKLAGAVGPAGAQGPAGAAAAKYWAYVTDTGSVGRSSGGVSAGYFTNGGLNKQYQVSFPVDVSQCGYQVTTGDTDPINQTMAADGFVPAVTRSATNNNTVAVTLWARNTANGVFNVANMGQGPFYISVFC